MLDKPTTIHTDEGIAPRGPWKFIIRALPGGFSFWGLQLIFAWMAFQCLTALSWAIHIMGKVGDSAIADNWGELLTARDFWEIMGNGQLQNSVFGLWAVAVGLVAMSWGLWAGWKLQAQTVGFAAGFRPWLLAVPSALVAGWLPLWVFHSFLWSVTSFLGGLGIQFLGWSDLVFSPLLRMAFVSALLLQWWLCRLSLVSHTPINLKGWLLHIKENFLRLWTYPMQWGSIVFGGVVLRTGLAFSVLLLAWQWGGQELSRLWLFFVLQLTVAALNAWIIGWELRLTAHFWKNDMEVRSEIRALETLVKRVV